MVQLIHSYSLYPAEHNNTGSKCYLACFNVYGSLSQNLMESLDSLLCAEGSESLKSLCLKLLLCLVTVSDPHMFVKGVNYSRVKPS